MFRSRGRWHYLGLSLLFVGGIVVGSELAVRGARGVVSSLGLHETVFGMTVVGFALSLEEVSLVVTPVREERNSIAVGNIVGSPHQHRRDALGSVPTYRGSTILE